MKSVLCDIEGTTTSIAFAKDILFPLSYQEMDRFIRENWNEPSVSNDLQAVKEEILKISPGKQLNHITPEEVISTLRSWIREDRKVTSLKSIQGKIWKDSFEAGRIRGHVYPDVPPAFKTWAAAGIQINIFSSGSVEAQKLVFRFSEAGDLSTFISHYFDTTTGPKKEPASYKAIAHKIDVAPSEILFLSDLLEELDAANAAGLNVNHVVRDPISGSNPSKYKVITAFDQIDF